MNTGSSDEFYMNMALEQAAKAYSLNEVPVGAVIIRDHCILSQGYNRRERDHDPCAHAEIVAIRRAAKVIGDWRLYGCTLFVTLEPCVMCIGAILQARILRLVYGAYDPKAGAVVSKMSVAQPGLWNHTLTSDYLPQAVSKQMLQTFFKSKR